MARFPSSDGSIAISDAPQPAGLRLEVNSPAAKQHGPQPGQFERRVAGGSQALSVEVCGALGRQAVGSTWAVVVAPNLGGVHIGSQLV